MSQTVYTSYRALPVAVAVALITMLACIAGAGLLFNERVFEAFDKYHTSEFEFFADFGLTGIFFAWLLCLALVLGVSVVESVRWATAMFAIIAAVCLFYFVSAIYAIMIDWDSFFTLGPIT